MSRSGLAVDSKRRQWLPGKVVNGLLRRQIRTEAETLPPGRYRSETFDLRFCPGVDPMKLNQLVDELEVDAFFESEAVDRR